MEAAPPTILCRGVTKRYDLGARSVEALRGVDLSLDGAGFYAVMGSSGSGKSTLMHLVAGLDRPTSGEVTVAGERVDRMNEAQLTLFRRRKIGIVFQHFNLLPSMSALDNVMLPALLDGMPRAASESRARELLEELGVAQRAAGGRVAHAPVDGLAQRCRALAVGQLQLGARARQAHVDQRHEAAAAGLHLNRRSHKGGGGSAAWMPPMRLAGCLLAAACGRSASRTMRPFSGGDARDSALGRGGSRGAGDRKGRQDAGVQADIAGTANRKRVSGMATDRQAISSAHNCSITWSSWCRAFGMV
jgi:predicted ABC-type transport system involved in lysophospholipase L1 biosynthesis ATPase subunit